MSDLGGSLKRCYKCNAIFNFNVGDTVPTDMVCEDCGSWVHCCANCHFFDEYASKHCREPQSEFVSDTRGKNSCDYFRFGSMRKGKPRTKKKVHGGGGGRSKGWSGSNYGGGRHDDGRGSGERGDDRGRGGGNSRRKLEGLFGKVPNNMPRPQQADPMDKLRGLFGDKPGSNDPDDDFAEDEEDAARRKLNRLFGDAPEKGRKKKQDPMSRYVVLFRKIKQDGEE